MNALASILRHILFKHEIDDDEVVGEEGHNEMAYLAASAGHLVSICLFLGAVFLTVIGAFQARTLGTEFLVGWFSSQIISVCITEVVFMTIVSAWKVYCYPNEIKKFHDKWRPHFERKGLPMPKSMSDVAAKAKKDYIAIRGPTAFYEHYRDYDKWFNLGDSEASLYEIGALDSISTQYRFSDNPMHAGPTSEANRPHSFAQQRKLSQSERLSQGPDDKVPRPIPSFSSSDAVFTAHSRSRSPHPTGLKLTRKPPSAPPKPAQVSSQASQ